MRRLKCIHFTNLAFEVKWFSLLQTVVMSGCFSKFVTVNAPLSVVEMWARKSQVVKLATIPPFHVSFFELNIVLVCFTLTFRFCIPYRYICLVFSTTKFNITMKLSLYVTNSLSSLLETSTKCLYLSLILFCLRKWFYTAEREHFAS